MKLAYFIGKYDDHDLIHYGWFEFFGKDLVYVGEAKRNLLIRDRKTTWFFRDSDDDIKYQIINIKLKERYYG